MTIGPHQRFGLVGFFFFAVQPGGSATCTGAMVGPVKHRRLFS